MTASPVREWGVRHGDDCRLTNPGVVIDFPTRPTADEALMVARMGGKACSATLVSRVPGGEWEPVEVEPAEPERFTVAEIEAAFDRLRIQIGDSSRLAKTAMLTALRAGREGEQG